VTNIRDPVLQDRLVTWAYNNVMNLRDPVLKNSLGTWANRNVTNIRDHVLQDRLVTWANSNVTNIRDPVLQDRLETRTDVRMTNIRNSLRDRLEITAKSRRQVQKFLCHRPRRGSRFPFIAFQKIFLKGPIRDTPNIAKELRSLDRPLCERNLP
jgi:hypothetical protein